MKLYEDILDDLDHIDSRSKDRAISDELGDPMDAAQFQLLLRFKLYYTNYKADDEWFRKLKHRIEDVIDGTSGVLERSRVMCVTDVTRPLYVKMSDEVEPDPYNSKNLWFMFAINPDFSSYREVCRFVIRIMYAIRSCQIEGCDMDSRPKLEYYSTNGLGSWTLISSYTDIDLLAARF